MFAIALPVLLFVAGISATCGVSKGETRDWQKAPSVAATVSISPTRP
jgi:hypothetical protein